MDNILYLDDVINFYTKKLNLIIVFKPYKDTLKNGMICDQNKFIKCFNNMLIEYKLDKSIFKNNLIVIINNNYNKLDKLILKYILNELNYDKIKFINEINLISLDSKTLFINYNQNYFYIYYLNELNKLKMNIYENNNLNKKLINQIIKNTNKQKVLIAGKNIKELLNIIKNKYYYYENANQLFIKKYLIKTNINNIF